MVNHKLRTVGFNTKCSVRSLDPRLSIAAYDMRMGCRKYQDCYTEDSHGIRCVD